MTGRLWTRDKLLRHGFLSIPVAIARLDNLSPGAKLTYGALMYYLAKLHRWPGQRALCEEFHMSERAVRNYMRELEKMGLIRIHRPKRRGDLADIELVPLADVLGAADDRQDLPVAPAGETAPDRQDLPPTKKESVYINPAQSIITDYLGLVTVMLAEGKPDEFIVSVLRSEGIENGQAEALLEFAKRRKV